MNEAQLLHEPRWALAGTEWHLVVGNRSVAKIVPNFCVRLGKAKWLSVIDASEYPDHGWHAVDFESLESAKYDIEQWWRHMRRGERFDPHAP
jgi:hypothetical protein